MFLLEFIIMTEIWAIIIHLQAKDSWATNRLSVWLLETKIRKIPAPNNLPTLLNKSNLRIQRRLPWNQQQGNPFTNLLSPIKILTMWSNLSMIRSSNNLLEANRLRKPISNRKSVWVVAVTRPNNNSTSSNHFRGSRSRTIMETLTRMLTRLIHLRLINSSLESEAQAKMWTREEAMG